MPHSEAQWQIIGYCKFCGCDILEMDGERLYTGPDDCNCEIAKTYKLSIHNGDNPLINEDWVRPGWTVMKECIPLWELRELISRLRAIGYTDEAILVEVE